MADDFISTLRNLNASGTGYSWHPVIPCPPAELEKIESRLALEIPGIMREILLAFGGGMLMGPAGQISLGAWQQFVDPNEDPYYEELTDMLIIGGDGGGNTLFVDVDNQLGFGSQAVFIVSDSEPQPAQARYLAGTIEDLFAKFLAREEYWDYLNDPPIGSRP